jgi:hypothetical protein
VVHCPGRLARRVPPDFGQSALRADRWPF